MCRTLYTQYTAAGVSGDDIRCIFQYSFERYLINFGKKYVNLTMLAIYAVYSYMYLYK